MFQPALVLRAPLDPDLEPPAPATGRPEPVWRLLATAVFAAAAALSFAAVVILGAPGESVPDPGSVNLPFNPAAR